MEPEPGLLSDCVVASYHESDLLVLTSHVLFHLGLIVIPQCPTHRCPVWCVGTKVLLAANSIFHLCTNTTNEDQPMVSKLFHARLAVVFQGCYLMLMCVVLLIKCCLCFMEGWGFCITVTWSSCHEAKGLGQNFSSCWFWSVCCKPCVQHICLSWRTLSSEMYWSGLWPQFSLRYQPATLKSKPYLTWVHEVTTCKLQCCNTFTLLFLKF